MAVIIQLRRGNASVWEANNPTLEQGEFGVELDTGRFKVGNGSDDWNTLPYSSGDDGVDGVTWHSGSGSPSAALGADGDFYLNTDTADIYIKSEGAWNTELNIQGPQGETTGAFDGGYPNSVYTNQTMDGGVIS